MFSMHTVIYLMTSINYVTVIQFIFILVQLFKPTFILLTLYKCYYEIPAHIIEYYRKCLGIITR